MVMLHGCYSPKERAEIEAAVSDYDDRTDKQIEADRLKAEQIEKGSSDFLGELQAAFDDEDMAQIQDLQADIAILISVRETWPLDGAMQERIKNIISIETEMIRKTYEEIHERKS